MREEERCFFRKIFFFVTMENRTRDLDMSILHYLTPIPPGQLKWVTIFFYLPSLIESFRDEGFLTLTSMNPTFTIPWRIMSLGYVQGVYF